MPANDKIVTKKSKLSGNIVPNFFKSLKLRMYCVSKLFINKKNAKTKYIYTNSTIHIFICTVSLNK